MLPRLAAAASALLLGACSVIGVRSGTVEPRFEIVGQQGVVEIRRYAPRLAAETLVEAASVEAARSEGKPENIITKMIEGRLRNFFSQCVLLEQPFVKDDKQTVGQLTSAAGLQVKRLENWRIGG